MNRLKFENTAIVLSHNVLVLSQVGVVSDLTKNTQRLNPR